MRFRSLLWVFLGVILMSFCVPSAFAAIRSTGTQTICRSDYDPLSGWIVVGVASFWKCGLFQRDNFFTIAPPPTTQTTICDASVLPPNMLIIAQESAPQCDGIGSTLLPQPKSASIDVCGSSPLPLNWVITAETNKRAEAALTCLKDTKLALEDPTHAIQRTIGPVPSGTTALPICAHSLIPAGFNAISTMNDPVCELDNGVSPFLVVESNAVAD